MKAVRTLPVASGATTAEAASTTAEATKASTAATAAAAEATSAAETSAAHPGTAAISAAQSAGEEQPPQQRDAAEEKEDDEKHDKGAEVRVMTNLPMRHRGRVGKGDTSVGCDDLRKLADNKGQSAIIIPGAQIGDHFPADVADLGVIEDAFEIVAHVNAVLAVVNR
jgi:hypothetical protein